MTFQRFWQSTQKVTPGLAGVLCALVVSLIAAGKTSGQDQESPVPTKKPAAKAPAAKTPARRDVQVEPPIELTGADLRTADGVGICATFYPSTKGKKAVAVVLLHGYGEDRSVFASLAQYLQKELDCAVLAPDLRGHGDSTDQRLGAASTVLDAKKFGNEQFGRMVHFDMETIRKYLVQQNNQGKLNIEALCLVGSEMGALVALNWAAFDWSQPVYPNLKQGQYVKAMVLLSPPASFRGLQTKDPLRHPDVRAHLSYYIIAGRENPKAFNEAQRLHSTLEPVHRVPDDEESSNKKDLFFKQLDTKLQGTKLLGSKSQITEQLIAKFIELRVVKQNFPWQESGAKKSGAAKE